jgi:hypothetical protein
MKNTLFVLLLLIGNSLIAKSNQDSLYLKIDQRDQRIIGKNTEGKISLREAIEKEFQKKGISLSDSLWQKVRTLIKADEGSNQAIKLQIGNQKVEIAMVKNNEIPESVAELHSNTNEKSVKAKEQIKVGFNGVHVVDGKDEVHVDWNGVLVKEADGSETKVIWGQDTSKVHPKEKNLNLYNRNGLNLYLGLNGLTKDIPPIQTAIFPPTIMGTDANIKPLSSRYVYLEIARSATLARYKKSALKLGYGLGIEWYNFIFDHNRIIENRNGMTIFQQQFDASQNEIKYAKNKLGISYLSVPFMPYLSFSKNSTIQMIGLGGYVAYRIDSWTKTIEEKNENLNKNANNFNINSFRYGIKAEIALKNFPDFFLNYDLSPVFDVNHGPKMTGFSFGIKLL